MTVGTAVCGSAVWVGKGVAVGDGRGVTVSVGSAVGDAVMVGMTVSVAVDGAVAVTVGGIAVGKDVGDNGRSALQPNNKSKLPSKPHRFNMHPS